jgi:choline kinase
MKIIILAAGRGSRINSYSKNHPKCLTEFRGKKLLESALENINHFRQKEDIYIVGGYKSELLGDYSNNLIINEQWNKSNIMMSLSCASQVLKNDNCLIVYSDIFFEKNAINLMLENQSPSVLNLTNWKAIWMKRFKEPLCDLENFTFDSTNKLTMIGSRASSLDDIMGQFGGMFTLNPNIWREIEKMGPELIKMDTTSCLGRLVDLGHTINVVNYDGYWAEIDSELDIQTQN